MTYIFNKSYMSNMSIMSYMTYINYMFYMSYFSAFTRPFKVIFKTDANEITTMGGAASTAINNEQAVAPGGIIGFQLNFLQISC